MAAARYLTRLRAVAVLAPYLEPDVARGVLDSGRIRSAPMPVANRPAAFEAAAIRALCAELRAIQLAADD